MTKPSRHPLFVVQQHDASTLHWDFRLQVGEVLKSWALPKGPSTDPKDKRLAVATEDHSLDYGHFEGTIQEGKRGAGSVIVWDDGRYENITEDEQGRRIPVTRALDEGRLVVWLEGKKIRGGYALLHAKVGGDEANWLLIKMEDQGADARRRPTSTDPRSVRSGRTNADVAAEDD